MADQDTLPLSEAQIRIILDQHETRLTKVEQEAKAVVTNAMMTHTARLEQIEVTAQGHGLKLTAIEKKNDDQTVKLGEIHGKICDHKDENHKKMLKIEADVSTLQTAVNGPDGDGGIAGDLALVRRAVVHGPAQIWGKRALYMLVSIAAIMVCLTMIIRPDSIPLFLRFLEAHSTGH